jgi:hypothetical protein
MISASFGCTKISIDEQSFGALNHDVVTTSDSKFGERFCRTRKTAMATALSILAATFAAGFLAEYAIRAWRSHRRRAEYAPKASAFGHPRRAF